MRIKEVIDYLEPVATSTPLQGYGQALTESVAVLQRATNMHDLTQIIKQARLAWNQNRDRPLDAVLATAVMSYLEGEKQ